MAQCYVVVRIIYGIINNGQILCFSKVLLPKHFHQIPYMRCDHFARPATNSFQGSQHFKCYHAFSRESGSGRPRQAVQSSHLQGALVTLNGSPKTQKQFEWKSLGIICRLRGSNKNSQAVLWVDSLCSLCDRRMQIFSFFVTFDVNICEC